MYIIRQIIFYLHIYVQIVCEILKSVGWQQNPWNQPAGYRFTSIYILYMLVCVKFNLVTCLLSADHVLLLFREVYWWLWLLNDACMMFFVMSIVPSQLEVLYSAVSLCLTFFRSSVLESSRLVASRRAVLCTWFKPNLPSWLQQWCRTYILICHSFWTFLVLLV